MAVDVLLLGFNDRSMRVGNVGMQSPYFELYYSSAAECKNGTAMLELILNGIITTTTTTPHDMCNNGGCIPKGVKRKDGQSDCCTEGRKTLKCPGPAHYKCGPHSMDTALFNRTANATATAAVGSAKPPSED